MLAGGRRIGLPFDVKLSLPHELAESLGLDEGGDFQGGDYDSDGSATDSSGGTDATTDSGESTTDGSETGSDPQAAEKKAFLDDAAASVGELGRLHSTLVASSDRLNRSIAARSDSGVRSARATLAVLPARIAGIKGRVPRDGSGAYTTVRAELLRLCDLALTRTRSQQAIADSFIAGKRGDELAAAGQPWGHDARVAFDKAFAAVKKTVASERAKL